MYQFGVAPAFDTDQIGRRIASQRLGAVADEFHCPACIGSAAIDHAGQVAHQRQQFAPAFLQRLVRPLALRNVLEGALHAHDLAALVAHCLTYRAHPEHLPVASGGLQFDVERYAGLHAALEHFANPRLVLRHVELQPLGRHRHLRRMQSEQFARLVRPGHRKTRYVYRPRAHPADARGHRQQGLALPQPRLGLALLRDVLGHPDDAVRSAVRVALHGHAHAHPDDAAIGGDVALLDDEAVARAALNVLHQRAIACQVVGMRDRPQRARLQFLLAVAQHASVCRIGGDEAAFQRGDRDAGRGVLEHLAEACFRRGDRLARTLTLGDVHHHAKSALGAAFGVEKHLAALVHPADLAIGATDAVSVLDYRSVGRDTLDRAGLARTILRQHHVEEGVHRARERIGCDAEQPAGLCRPGQTPVRQIELPAAHRGDSLRFVEQRTHALGLTLRGLLGGDVGMGANHAQRDTTGVACHHLAAIEYPAKAAVARAHPELGLVEGRVTVHVIAYALQRGFEIVRMHARRPRVKPVRNVRRCVAKHGAPAIGEEHLVGQQIPVPHALIARFEGELPALLQRLQRGLGMRLHVQLSAQPHLRHHLVGQRAQRTPLKVIEAARDPVDHAQGAQHLTVRRQQRSTRVETDARPAGNQRIVGEARIERRVRDFKQIGGMQSVGAERNITRGMRDLDADARLEPLARAIDQRHEGDRRHAQPGGQARDVVERRLRRRVEDIEFAQRTDTRRLVSGIGCFHRSIRRMPVSTNERLNESAAPRWGDTTLRRSEPDEQARTVSICD